MTQYPTPLEQQYGARLADMQQRVAVLERQMAQAQSTLQTAANPPMFRMRQTVAQPIPSGGSPTIVTMDTPEYDTANARATSSPWTYTIPAAYSGKWQFVVHIPMSSGANAEHDVYLMHNGTPVVGSQFTDTSSSIISALMILTIPVVGGDVMAAAVYQQTGASENTFIGTNIMPTFEGRLVSRGNP